MRPFGEAAQFVLEAGAEALLLVDDQQAEPVEAHFLAGDRVRADHDVDRAVRQAVLDARATRPASTSRDKPATRVPNGGEAAAESLQMLAHQHRGRRDERDLAAR